MNRKDREREAGWILATCEAEAEAAAWKARAEFWQAVHRTRTNEAMRLPTPRYPDAPLAEWERELLHGEWKEAR